MAHYTGRRMMTTTISNETFNTLKKWNQEMQIPKSRIIDMGVKLFDAKYSIKEGKGDK